MVGQFSKKLGRISTIKKKSLSETRLKKLMKKKEDKKSKELLTKKTRAQPTK